jgi:capsular exopolysaccharide synthesis family protein
VLRTLILKRLGEGPCVVLITSARGGEGKTTLACQLALSMAGSWRKTLLLDAALRKPAVHHMFHNACEPGFSELLRGEVEPDDVVQSTPVSRLWVLPAGQSDNHALQALAQERTAFLVDHFRKQYDCVVIDAGPVLASADALLLGQHVDAVLLVARMGSSGLRAIYTAHEHLHSLELPVLGCVVVEASAVE